MNKKLILIGYWSDGPDSKYPDPYDLIDTNFYKKNWEIESQLIAYLSFGKPCNFYRGFLLIMS